MKLWWCVLVVLTIVLQYRLWVGEGSYNEAWVLQTRIEVQQQANSRLAGRNSRLDAEVIDLQDGHDAIEERARTDLGMIGHNETFYLVVSSGR